MNRRERNKQKKQKARQDRIRQEKHERQAVAHPLSRADAGATAAPANQPASGERPAPHPAKQQPGPEHPSETPIHPADAVDDFFRGEPARGWMEKLLAEGANLILSTLDVPAILPPSLVLKASVCGEILAAAEVVAAGRGRPSRHLPENLARWLREQQLYISPNIATMAAEVVRRVADHSELRHVWDAVKLAHLWLPGVENLLSRLRWSEEKEPTRPTGKILSLFGQIEVKPARPAVGSRDEVHS